MVQGNYKVEITERRNVAGGQKIKADLVDTDSGDTVVEQWKGLSDKQIKNRLESILRQWAVKAAEDYESEDPDVTGTTVDV